MPADPTKIKNRVERLAHLLAEAIEDQAERIVAAMDEPPMLAMEPDAETQRRMWDYSPFGAEAPAVFWDFHDLVLAQTGDDQQAEELALREVYPYRLTLAGVGFTPLADQVQRANRVRRLVERQPAALPPPSAPQEVAYS